MAKAAKKANKIIVAEMNYGQLVREVQRAAKETPVVFLSKLGEDPHTSMEILKEIRKHNL